jgi:hypothetical protein
MSAYLEPDPRGRDLEFLDAYAAERWETVLHYMVASNQQAGISTDAVSTLLQVRGVAVSDSQCPNPNSGPSFFLSQKL